MTLEELKAKLCKGEFSSFHLSFNDITAPNYCTVAKYLDDYGPEDFDRYGWVSPEERQKAIDTNSWWLLQWYPETPVGFCWLSASSLEALLAAANAE